jgi:hypothetical protein
MDSKGQTAVLLSIFVLVGMMILVPAITEKALAGVNAVATISGCEKYTQPFPCKFTVVGSHLDSGKWVVPPTASGDTVKWQTTGNPKPGTEKGLVYLEGAGGAHGKVQLYFYNPVLGSNSCRITHLTGGFNFGGTCDAGSGQNADFTYTFRVFSR